MTVKRPTMPPAGDRQHVPTDQAAPELLPCPFCGSVDLSFADMGVDGGFTICLDCESQGPFGNEDGWNRRADLAAPSAQQAQDHRSFHDAADGRPMPPMGDELMTAGLNGDDARFVAIQLAQNGLRLTPAPSAPAEVEGLVKLRRAADEADGDPARYPRRGIIDRYQSAVVAAYENGNLVAATALTAQQAEIERLRKERDAWKANAGELAVLLGDAVGYFPMGSRSDVQWVGSRKKALAAHAKLKGGV